MNDQLKPVAIAVGAAFAASVAATALAEEVDLFSAESLEQEALLLAGAHGDGEGSCGEKDDAEGSCGEGEKEGDEGACGEGSCGEEGHDAEEGSCGEGSCGEEDA